MLYISDMAWNDKIFKHWIKIIEAEMYKKKKDDIDKELRLRAVVRGSGWTHRCPLVNLSQMGNWRDDELHAGDRTPRQDLPWGREAYDNDFGRRWTFIATAGQVDHTPAQYISSMPTGSTSPRSPDGTSGRFAWWDSEYLLQKSNIGYVINWTYLI